MAYGLVFKVEGSGPEVAGLAFGGWDQGAVCRVQGPGLRVQGSGSKVEGPGSRAEGAPSPKTLPSSPSGSKSHVVKLASFRSTLRRVEG